MMRRCSLLTRTAQDGIWGENSGGGKLDAPKDVANLRWAQIRRFWHFCLSAAVWRIGRKLWRWGLVLLRERGHRESYASVRLATNTSLRDQARGRTSGVLLGRAYRGGSTLIYGKDVMNLKCAVYSSHAKDTLIEATQYLGDQLRYRSRSFAEDGTFRIAVPRCMHHGWRSRLFA